MGKCKPPIVAPCSICGTVFTLPQSKWAYWRKTGRAICSADCRKTSAARTRRGPLSTDERISLSARMVANNPMNDPETREKVSARLREIGHKPPVRGGNGHGPTRPQRLLAEALDWPMEVIIPTGQRRKGGLPSHYKVDIGNPDLKVAIEVDGGSHCSLAGREADRRKAQWLTGKGWAVLRFTNREVLADVKACADAVLAVVDTADKGDIDG